MSDAVNNLGEDAPEYDYDDDIPKPSLGKTIGVWAGIIGGVLLGLGLLTWAIGIGPFGYRLFRYGTATLHIYNGTPHFAEVTIDGTMYEVKPYKGEMVELTGGDVEIDTTLHLVSTDKVTGKSEITDEREHLETMSWTASDDSPWLYHVATEESTCLAITDLTGFYGGTNDPVILEKVFKDERLRPLPFENVIYPQDAMPDKVVDKLIWLAVVNCGVLENDIVATEKIAVDAITARQHLEKRRKDARREQGITVD